MVVATLVAAFVRATQTRRVLEVGTGSGTRSLAIVGSLPADGRLITLERDAAVAAGARQALAAAGYADRVFVIIGDAARYLHKLAGPFDLIVQDGNAGGYEALHQRLVERLAPSGTLITHNMNEAGGYNEMLAADMRLATVTLAVANGVAISVLRGDPS